MPEVLVNRFHDMSAQLAARIEDTLADYAREHGQVYNPSGMHQSHLSVRELAQDALMFGMDVWVHDPDQVDGDFGGNVVRLSVGRARVRPRSRTYNSVRLAMSIVGAVVGSTIIAAATTETVSLPYFDKVAHFVYSKNAPPEVERLIEENGHVYAIRAVRRPGEPWNMVHVVEKHELSPSEIGRVVEPPAVAGMHADDGTALNDVVPHG